MGSKYSTVTVSGYNSTPPADDGSQVAANQVKYSTTKTKLSDPLKTAIEAINTALVNALDFGSRQISSSDTTLTSDHMKTVEIAPTTSTSITVSLGDAVTMAAGYIVTVRNSSANDQTIGRITGGDKINGVAANLIIPKQTSITFKVANTASEGYLTQSQSGNVVYDPADPTKSFALNIANVPAGTRVVAATGGGGILPAGIGPLPYSGNTIPPGWLECDGSSYSNTAYPALFAAIGTTWGGGSGTFKLPDGRNRVFIGAGTGTEAETVTSANVDTSGNTFTVISNSTLWITGKPVILTTTGTLPTGLSLATPYYVIRVSATTIRFASSLANAQNGTAITLSTPGAGSHTLTNTYTARTLGEYGGEETHAIKSTEELLHGHSFRTDPTVGGASDATGGFMLNNAGDINHVAFTGTPTDTDGEQLGGFGGNVAMNIMQPFGVVKYIISY